MNSGNSYQSDEFLTECQTVEERGRLKTASVHFIPGELIHLGRRKQNRKQRPNRNVMFQAQLPSRLSAFRLRAFKGFKASSGLKLVRLDRFCWGNRRRCTLPVPCLFPLLSWLGLSKLLDLMSGLF